MSSSVLFIDIYKIEIYNINNKIFIKRGYNNVTFCVNKSYECSSV